MPTTFADLGLLPSLLTTLTAQQLVTLTDIQVRALPELLARRSVVGIAETGSGKTLTYVLPILHHLKVLEDAGNKVEVEREPRALVIVPTRELGEQVSKVFKTFTHDTRLRVRTVLGGQKAKQNHENIGGNFEVLVATPGRLDGLVKNEKLSLAAIRIVVLDEADQLLDHGFVQQVMDVLGAVPSQRQLALFSATMSPVVEAFVTGAFAEAMLLRTDGANKVVASLQTRHVDVPDGKRLDALRRVLTERVDGGTLLFANTREQCEELSAALASVGWSSTVHRGDMDATERRKNLQAFRDGEVDLLIATDMGARGLDIEHVARVINVHLPRELDTYLHRVGRTARAGRTGIVVNLVTPRDARFLALLGDGAQAPKVVHPPRQLPPKPPVGPRTR